MQKFSFFLFTSFILIGILERCADFNSSSNDEKLAQRVCGGCHTYPDPTSLPKEYWQNHIFPSMAKFMGRYVSEYSRDSLFEKGEGGEKVKRAGVFPEHPILSDDEWNKIYRYYLSKAPNSLPSKVSKYPLLKTLFSIETPVRIKDKASTTLLKWTKNGNLIYGDAGVGNFIEFGSRFVTKKIGELEQAPVHFIQGYNEDIVTVMGSFSPTDAATGMLLALPSDERMPPALLVDKLQRPVHTTVADLDKDGKEELIVCEFGKFTGSLSLFSGNRDQGFKKSKLSTTPGAIKSYIADLNGDGRLDIVALFGQARERIEVFLNQGRLNFKSLVLLEFPPYYGSSGFQLKDIDGDGDEDIIYTAGDNADYDPIVKPFHGIYVFENTGNLRFIQKYFLPMPGAYAAHLADFDLDGKLDLLGVSFFPDWTVSQPADCLLWKGNGKGFSKPAQLPLSHLGRWIVSDIGDCDGDGDTDVILGSLMLEVKPDKGQMNQWLKEKTPFVVLKNKTK